jgi:hypothetical protein
MDDWAEIQRKSQGFARAICKAAIDIRRTGMVIPAFGSSSYNTLINKIETGLCDLGFFSLLDMDQKFGPFNRLAGLSHMHFG